MSAGVDAELIETVRAIVRRELEAAGVGFEALTKSDAARRLGMSVRTLDREIAAGNIQTVRTRDRQKITIDEIKRYLELSGNRHSA